MVQPIPFRPRPQVEQLQTGVDVTLGKDERRRRFSIRAGGRPHEWYCQVWMGEETQHRGETVTDLPRVHRLKAEYLREIAELERDGWSVVAGVDPRPAKGIKQDG